MRYLHNRPKSKPSDYDAAISNIDEDGNQHQVAKYSDLKNKSKLKNLLARIQGYRCATCGSRISVATVTSKESATIEHVMTQSQAPQKSLEYENLVVCCNRDSCCNHGRGSTTIGRPFYFDPESFTDAEHNNPYFNVTVEGEFVAHDHKDANSFLDAYKLNANELVTERMHYWDSLVLDYHEAGLSKAEIADKILKDDDLAFCEFMYLYTKGWWTGWA